MMKYHSLRGPEATMLRVTLRSAAPLPLSMSTSYPIRIPSRSLTTTKSLLVERVPQDTLPNNLPPRIGRVPPKDSYGIAQNLVDQFEDHENRGANQTFRRSDRGSYNNHAQSQAIRFGNRKAQEEEALNASQQYNIERMAARRWEAGDVYHPHDLTPAEMRKWKQRQRPTKDIFDEVGVDPLDEWKVRVMPLSPNLLTKD